MNYLALVRAYTGGKAIHLRPESKVAELVELAQHGDTLHKIPEPFAAGWRSEALLALVASQLQNKEFKQL